MANLSDIQTLLGYLKTVPTLVIAFAGAAMAFIKVLEKTSAWLNQGDEKEAKRLLAEHDRFKTDPDMLKVIHAIEKARFFKGLFGLVPLGCEMQALMEFFISGYATRYQIRQAWPHHRIVGGKLSFALTRLGRIWLFLVYIISIFLMVLAILALFLGVAINSHFVVGSRADELSFFMVGVLVFSAAVLFLTQNLDFIIADAIDDRMKK